MKARFAKPHHIENLLAKVNQRTVWTFTGLHGLELHQDQIDLGENYFLSKPNQFLLSARDRYSLNGYQYREMENLSCFFVLKELLPDSPDAAAIERLQNGVMALQILKPVKSFGFIFQGFEVSLTLSLQRTVQRSPMEAGEWAHMAAFHDSLLPRLAALIKKIKAIMSGPEATKRNAIILLQLGLESQHPLIAGLFSVMGMEAIFDSGNRNDFKKKLCDCLGATTLAFPDWNSPISPPPYTVEELAIPLYMLRNKLAHGADLRTARLDKTTPVDLLKKVELIPDTAPRAHALLLSEASHYLLCQILQKAI